jgi:two-component system chemotaxis response regulator CheY
MEGRVMAFNVLVVDDSATMRMMVMRTLQMTGLPLGEMHQAGNGREGLAALESAWIDIVFVDINMPVMDGLAMIDAVRGRPDWAGLPIVVISTESSRTRIEEVRHKGVEFIHKPFTPECVGEVMRRVLGEVSHASH